MKTKLQFATKTDAYDVWTQLSFIPRINERFNVKDLLKEDEIAHLRTTAMQWSGNRGIVQSVEYRHDENDFYTEIVIRCED
jgi:hypothetical protein